MLTIEMMATSRGHRRARIDDVCVAPWLARARALPGNVALLAAPLSPEQAETVRPNIVRLTLQLAPQAFDYVVVDTSSDFGECSLIALELAQMVLVPVTPDVAAMKSAVNTMRVLQAVNIKQDKVRFLQNEIVPRAGLTKDQLESGLGKDLTAIPHAGPAFVEAGNQGVPAVMAENPVPAARAIMDIARSLCTPEMEVAAPQRAGIGVLKGRFEDSLQRLKRA